MQMKKQSSYRLEFACLVTYTRLDIQTLHMLIFLHGAKAKQFSADARVAGHHAPKAAHLHYGYDLSKNTGLSSGTLYPLLMRLSDQGLLESQWQKPERPGKPPRHVYRLTSEGLAFARTLERGGPAVVRNRIVGAIT